MNKQDKCVLVMKQNIIKNVTVLAVSIIFAIWSIPFIRAIGDAGTDAFLFLSIFPLGSMFAYFSFSYSNTNLDSIEHRALADLTTFILLLVICFSISFATLVGVFSMPEMKLPFIVLATLLIVGCISYDFWDLHSNISK